MSSKIVAFVLVALIAIGFVSKIAEAKGDVTPVTACDEACTKGTLELNECCKKNNYEEEGGYCYGPYGSAYCKRTGGYTDQEGDNVQ